MRTQLDATELWPPPTSENFFANMILRMVRSVSIIPSVVRVPMFFMVSSDEQPTMPSVELTVAP